MCVVQLLLSAAAFAQTQVTGHVADVRGEDIIGANVTVRELLMEPLPISMVTSQLM